MDASASREDTTILRLCAGEFLPLRSARDRSIAVLRGRLWIARGEGRQDAFLRPGQTFALDVAGGAMLHALEASSLQLIEHGTSRAHKGWRRRLQQATRRWLTPLARGRNGAASSRQASG